MIVAVVVIADDDDEDDVNGDDTIEDADWSVVIWEIVVGDMLCEIALVELLYSDDE